MSNLNGFQLVFSATLLCGFFLATAHAGALITDLNVASPCLTYNATVESECGLDSADSFHNDFLGGYNHFCGSACRNALMRTAWFCGKSNPCTSDKDPNAYNQAIAKLKFCDYCIHHQQKAITACAGGLTLTGSAAQTEYCGSKPECSNALHNVVGYCASDLSSEDLRNMAFKMFTNTNDVKNHKSVASTYFQQAKDALAQCQLSTSIAPAQLLADSRELSEIHREMVWSIWQFYDGTSDTYGIPSSLASHPEKFPSYSRSSLKCCGPQPSPSFTYNNYTGVNANAVQITRSDFTSTSECKTFCDSLAWCGSGDCNTKGSALCPRCRTTTSCWDICDNCPSECATCDPLTFESTPNNGASMCSTFGSSDERTTKIRTCSTCGANNTLSGCNGEEEYMMSCDGDPFTGPQANVAFALNRKFRLDSWPGGTRPEHTWEQLSIMANLSSHYYPMDTAQKRQWAYSLKIPVSPLYRGYGAFGVNNTGTVVVSSSITQLVLISPWNGCVAGNCGQVTVNAASFAHILFVNVYSETSNSVDFNSGNIQLNRGINMGPGPINFNTTSRVVVSDILNYGTVNFYHGKKNFLLSATNEASGTINILDAGGTVYECSNKGTIWVRNSNATLDKVTNEAGGFIKAVNLQATLVEAHNKAGATIETYGGVYTFSGDKLQNYGTITVGSAFSGARRLLQSTNLYIQGGVNYGSVSIASGTTIALTLDVNNGNIEVASGVTGTIAMGDTSTGTVSGAGASGISQTTFKSTNPLVTGNSTPGSSTKSKKDNKKLSPGALAGIIVGATVFVLAAVGGVWIWYCRRSNRTPTDTKSTPTTSQTSYKPSTVSPKSETSVEVAAT